MKQEASTNASLLMIMTAVFLLITTQLAVTSSELRISRMHERYSGLYPLGVSAAEARVRLINTVLTNAAEDLLAYYMENYEWESQCELRDGAFVLTGEAFHLAYQEIARNYNSAINAPDNTSITITHESGLNIFIQPKFGNVGTTFNVTVKNNSDRPYVKNMSEAVEITGQIVWNSDPPIYTLVPKFDINEETLDGKGFHDFSVSYDSGYTPVKLAGVQQE